MKILAATYQVQLTNERFSAKQIKEIRSHTPAAIKFERFNVPGIGMTTYVYDSNGMTLGHVYKEYQKGVKVTVYLIKK